MVARKGVYISVYNTVNPTQTVPAMSWNRCPTRFKVVIVGTSSGADGEVYDYLKTFCKEIQNKQHSRILTWYEVQIHSYHIINEWVKKCSDRVALKPTSGSIQLQRKMGMNGLPAGIRSTSQCLAPRDAQIQDHGQNTKGVLHFLVWHRWYRIPLVVLSSKREKGQYDRSLPIKVRKGLSLNRLPPVINLA